MSSRCRPAGRLIIAVAALSLLAACDRERRDLGSATPEAPPQTRVSELVPGLGGKLPPDPRGEVYETSAFHVSAGSQLFRWYNCNGCHANGGGGMGPALIDDEWRYGSSIDEIYRTIYDGRPNGMPSFRGKATEQQIWQLAAYVRSLGGQTPGASSSRREAISSTPPRNQVTPPDTKGEGEPAVQGTAP